MPVGAGTSAQCRCDFNVILGPWADLALSLSQGQVLVQGRVTRSGGRNREKHGCALNYCHFLVLVF